jgi:16S rRNA (guanine527-N7)-methyltransferase
VDNIDWSSKVSEGARALGITLSDEQIRALVWFGQELVRWNARVNLTAVTEPLEVIEKHLLDSVAALAEIGEASRVLDVGSGAGLPGLALKIARPALEVEVVDTVGKKVAFSKHAIAQLRLFPGARATQARAEGNSAKEGLAVADVVISRAFMDVGPWVALARHYVKPGGRVVAMSGRAEDAAFVDAARSTGLALQGARRFTLPFSGAPRVIASFLAP